MSEKMREDFDAWTMQYGFDDGEHMWQAWQASRAALVVELPSDINGEYYADGWNAALMCVEGMLEEAGVSYK